MVADDDGDGERAETGPPERETAVPSPPGPVTTGRYDAPVGTVPTEPTAIRAEIEAAIASRDLVAVGELSGPAPAAMFVSLPLGREHIADQLIARYGDILRVDVGGMPWPLDDAETMFAGCSDPLPAGDVIDGLSATVTPDSSEIALGEAVTGSVVLTNASSEPVTFTWSGAGVRGHLIRPGTDEPVGMFVGAETMQFAMTRAPAGGTSEPVPLVVGIASCRPQIHTAVQPGRYELVALLPLEDGHLIRSAPVDIAVSAP